MAKKMNAFGAIHLDFIHPFCYLFWWGIAPGNSSIVLSDFTSPPHVVAAAGTAKTNFCQK